MVRNEYNKMCGLVFKNSKKHNSLEILLFSLRWEENDEDTVKVSGTPLHVKSFLEWFDVQCKHVEMNEEFDAHSFE